MLFHGNLNVLFSVLYKIINKICVKTEIAQNDTDLSCIKLDTNVSKCFTKAQHFETLISSLIQNKLEINFPYNKFTEEEDLTYYNDN